MIELLQRIQNRLRQRNFYGNEHAIRQGVVLPLFTALGYDIERTDILLPEYPIGTGYVDLMIRFSDLYIPIEFKRDALDRERLTLADRKQLYSRLVYLQKPPLAVLTSGRLWYFYMPEDKWQESGLLKDEQCVCKIDLMKDSIESCAKALTMYLSFDIVTSGLEFIDRRPIVLARSKKACGGPNGIMPIVVKNSKPRKEPSTRTLGAIPHYSLSEVSIPRKPWQVQRAAVKEK